MEIPTPSTETIGKFFGGIVITILGGWAFLKRIGLIGKESEEEVIMGDETSVTRYLRRSEDAGLRMAVEKLEGRIDRIEDRVDKKFVSERDFYLDQLKNSEERLSTQVNEVSIRLDGHTQGINERLDFIISQVKK